MAGDAAALRREIGLGTAALMVVGGIIGSGIFFTPAQTAAHLPGTSWILAVWACGGVVALAGALAYAELGAMMPLAGGSYVYIREAFGARLAFLNGWMILLLIASGAIAAVAMGFAGYLERFVALDAVGGRLGTAALTIGALTVTNYFGVRPGVVVTNVLTSAKLAALAALVLVAVAWGVGMLPARAGIAPALAPVAPSLLRGVPAAFVAVLFTIGGWQQLNMVAGEVRDPARTIPRALLLGILVVIAVYLGVVGAYLAVLGRDGLAASAAPAADTMQAILGRHGGAFISAAAMCSILGFVQVALLANARVLYALGADGAFLRAAARVHPRWGSPHVAILLLGGWSLVLLLVTRGGIGALLSGVVFADWVFFGLGAASVFVLRRTRPDTERPYRVPGYPWLPALFVGAALVGIASAIVSAPGMSLLGGFLLVLGAGLHARLG